MVTDPTADSNIKASAETVATITETLASAVIESETKCLFFGPAKIRRRIFGNSCLTMHICHLTKPWRIFKLWLNPTAGLYSVTTMHREYQVPPNPIMPLTTLSNCCVIIYFDKQPSNRPGLVFLHIPRAPIDYAQSGYVAAFYGITAPALETNLRKEYRTVSCFDKHPCTRFRFYTNSAGSHEMGDWNCMLLTSAAVPLPLRDSITVELGSTYANGIFAVGTHTSEQDHMSDFLLPLTRILSSGATGSSQILLPQVFLLASHDNVPAKVSLLVVESNRITTEAKLVL